MKNHWKSKFIFVILTIILFDGTFAVSNKSDPLNGQLSDLISKPSKWIIDNDQYNLTSFDQRKGDWPPSHPLPLPLWSNESKKPFIFQNMAQFEDFDGKIQTILNQMFKDGLDDSVSNLVAFYKSYKKSGLSNLTEFFHSHNVSVNRHEHNFVTITMEMVHRLSVKWPELSNKLYLVSCEKRVKSVQKYIENWNRLGIEKAAYNLIKNYTSVAMRIKIAFREGVMLLQNPNIIVMKDREYPHTGCYVYSRQTPVETEICYKYNEISDDFIDWTHYTKYNDETIEHLVYVKKPFCSAIDVSLRRNLVSTLRGLTCEKDSRFVAGLVFYVNPNDPQFNLVYELNGRHVNIDVKFNLFADLKKIPDDIAGHLDYFAAKINWTKDDLCNLLKNSNEMMMDRNFVNQLTSIDNSIISLSDRN